MQFTLLSLSCLFAFAAAKRPVHEFEKRFSRSHHFPDVLPNGKQSVNEFQFVDNEKIVLNHYLREDNSYVIKDISPLVIDNDDIVTVSFQSTKPSSSDWIGAYSPANVDITTTVPVKYGWCDDDMNYLGKGTGALTFNMTNLRGDIAFYYFTNSTGHPILVANANENQIVSFRDNNQPLKPRVVPTGDYDVFNLLWSSATSQKPVLRWGTTPGSYDKSVEAKTSTISRDSLCGKPANTTGWFDLGMIHTAEFKGMKALANTKIYYIFGDENTNDFSREYIFNVPPLAGQQRNGGGTKVILYDDLGRGTNDMTFTW